MVLERGRIIATVVALALASAMGCGGDGRHADAPGEAQEGRQQAAPDEGREGGRHAAPVDERKGDEKLDFQEGVAIADEDVVNSLKTPTAPGRIVYDPPTDLSYANAQRTRPDLVKPNAAGPPAGRGQTAAARDTNAAFGDTLIARPQGDTVTAPASRKAPTPPPGKAPRDSSK